MDMDFNSDGVRPKQSLQLQTEEENESKDMEKEENIQANLCYSWGFSKYGQTGHDYTNFILTPSILNFSQELNSEEFPRNIEIEPVTGEYHSAFLIKTSKENYLYMFGKNAFGQLGIGENAYIFEPSLVSSFLENEKEKVIKVSLGGEHTIILTNKNNIYTCGLNIFGQLSTGDFENRTNFTNIHISDNVLNNEEDEKIVDIAAGAQHSLIISNMNRLYYCGFNKSRLMGIYEDINLFTYIKNENLNQKIILIRARMNISGVLFEDRKSMVVFGQELDLLNKSPDMFLIKISDIESKNDEKLEIKDFKFGNEFIEVLLSNGNVYTCGINNKCQLGIDENIIAKNEKSDKKLVFYKVSIPEKIIQIETGYDNSIVISVTGKIYSWGSNYYGQICQTSKSSINKPCLITNSTIENLSLYAISAGAYHTIAIYKGDASNIPEEEQIFDIYKYKLSSLYEKTSPNFENAKNILMNTDDFEKEYEAKKKEIQDKKKELEEKIKSLGVIPEKDLSKYSRGFENNFEISLSELEFDEEVCEIGKGTFGDVLRGVWRGEDVAVKFLKGSMTDSQESIKQFIDECNILKNLHHPNILLFMGACTIGPQYFIVSEFCDNGNLFEYLHMIKSLKLNYDDARRIALEIAYGMTYLHGFKPPILHRDLKSMNVLLDRNLNVKLADFGNTRTFQLQMTKQKGTFQWMAPEVIKGNTYTESSDVFSFGIIMNELVTRVPPYQGTDKKDVAKKVVNNPNYRPPYNEKKVPKDWINIMTKCWQHDPKDRPTFSEVVDLLEKADLPGNVQIKIP